MEEKVTKCSVSKKCGSCQYQGVPYKEQLAAKQKRMKKLLGKFANVKPIIGMDDPFYYRNKVHAVFDRDKKGNIICGTYEAKTHKVVPIEECMIEDKISQEIIRTIRDMLKSFRIKTYDEDTGYGLLRHVLVRRGFSTDEIMVVLVIGSPIFPSKNNFVKALRKKYPQITTVVLNVNDKKTSMVLGERDIVIYGKGYIRDTLCGCTFRISPQSFYQVNPVQTEILYKTAIEYAGLGRKETVIDAYCGIGTIGLVAAKRAKNIIGVELNPDAVRDARINAKENKITKVEILAKQSKFEKLKKAMNDIGVTGMTVTQVLGCGTQKGAPEYYRGVEVDMQLLPKIQVEMVVSKVPVADVIDAARKALYTGHIGDGKIFVYDVEDVVKVRTGETGYDALQGADD